MPRRVVLVAGPPCAGKSTWAREHAGPDTQIVDWDDLARQAGSTARWNHAQRYRDAAEARMQRWLEHIAQSTEGDWIVVRTLGSPTQREALAAHLRAELVTLCPPRDVLIARAQQRTLPQKTITVIDRWLRQNGKLPRQPARFPKRDTTSRGKKHDQTHRNARAAAAKHHHPSDPCARCGQPLGPMGRSLHYDHDDKHGGYLGFSHAACNQRAGAILGNQRSRTARQRPWHSRAWG